MNNLIKPLTRHNNLLTQNIADEFLIYDLNVNKAFSLNKTSSMIWQLCDGSRTIGEIAADAGKKLKSNVSEELIALAIDQFKQDELLADNEIKISALSGMSRRQLIRKVGMASMVALPLITPLFVPQAAHAQSGCFPDGTPCDPRIRPTPCCGRCLYGSGTISYRCSG